MFCCSFKSREKIEFLENWGRKSVQNKRRTNLIYLFYFVCLFARGQKIKTYCPHILGTAGMGNITFNSPQLEVSMMIFKENIVKQQ